MPGNFFGTCFRIATWGESHGQTIGVVVDGCPAGLPIDTVEIQRDLDRRRPGQSRLTTQRQEADQIRIMSGVFEGQTLGTPIAMLVENTDARPRDYAEMKDVFRPSHADMTYQAKYGRRNWMGGGRASARETLARVAAGAIARKWLAVEYGVEIVAWVQQVHEVVLSSVDYESVTREVVDQTPVRCPDAEVAARMIERIEQARRDRDSVGGVVEVLARGCPAGWGEPVFDKLDALLAHQLMSLPAAKGVEIGSGFRGLLLTGSEHNDEFFIEDGVIKTRTNNSGGIQGGITNGMPVVARVAFKPTATVNKEQRTVTANGEAVVLAAKGRHDPCVLPRAVPIVEAVTAIVLMDAALLDRVQSGRAHRPTS